MLSIQRFYHLAEKITVINKPADAQQLTQQLVSTPTPLTPEVIAFANAHAFNLAARHTPFYEQLISADYLLRDGVGVKWLLTFMGKPPGRNMNGTDLIPKMIDAAATQGRRVAIIGATPEVMAKAQQQLITEGVHLVFAVDGYQPFAEYVELLDKHQPEICLLAMGMPRQEALASHIKALQRHAVRLWCGGAILDFYTNTHKRAPDWMRKRGLEWLYRFSQEPRRLFYRYVIGNPLFLLRTLLLKITMRKIQPRE